MRREIEMPRLSETVDEGVLVTWLVAPGATVREGDLIAEVQVEKASSEVRAPAAGRMAAFLVGAGDVVNQGAPIAVLETAEPSAGASLVGVMEPKTAAGTTGDVEMAGGPGVAEMSGAPSTTGMSGAPSTTEAGSPGGVVASPSAKRLARELGVDLGSMRGSGPGGRIVEADVRGAAAAHAPAAGAATDAAGGMEPLSAMRRTIADRLRSGLAATAQLTITTEADVTELEARLAEWSADRGRRATFNDAIVRACALALRAHPRVAARWSDRGLVPAERIDIGIAVALDDGLIVPVVRDADHKDLATLGREIDNLAERARSGTLASADTEGGCFSVTNLGAWRIDAFTPLLNPPQSAILGVGRARPRPAVVDGAVVPRTLVALSLTFDHQVIDGAPAAAFLEAIVDLLEHPARLTAGS